MLSYKIDYCFIINYYYHDSCCCKIIGADIELTGVIGAGIGTVLEVIFYHYLETPLLKREMFFTILLGFALVEATALLT